MKKKTKSKRAYLYIAIVAVAYVVVVVSLSISGVLGGNTKINAPEYAHYFGYTVAADGDRIVVGADSQAFVYDCKEIDWRNNPKSLNDKRIDGLGNSLAIENNRIIVTSFRWVFVYEYIDGSWRETRLDIKLGNRYASPVGLSGNRVAVGTKGGVYIFELKNNNWQKTKVLPLVDAGQKKFGRSIGIDKNRLVVCWSLGDIKMSETIDVYEYDGANWQGKEICASANKEKKLSRASVAIDGNRIVVGMPRSGPCGAISVYDYHNGNWDETKIISTASTSSGRLGYSVAIDGKRFVATGSKYIRDKLQIPSLYTFEYIDGNWHETKVVIGNAQLGNSCAVVGDKIITGAYFNTSPSSIQRYLHGDLKSNCVYVIE